MLFFFCLVDDFFFVLDVDERNPSFIQLGLLDQVPSPNDFVFFFGAIFGVSLCLLPLGWWGSPCCVFFPLFLVSGWLGGVFFLSYLLLLAFLLHAG